MDRAGELAEGLVERVDLEAELVLPPHDASHFPSRAARSERRSAPMIAIVAAARPRLLHEGEASRTSCKRP